MPSVFRHHHHNHHCRPFTAKSRNQSCMEVLCVNWSWFCNWPLGCWLAPKEKWILQTIIVLINLFSCHPHWRAKMYKVAVGGAMPDTAKIRSRTVRYSAVICPVTKLLEMSRFVNRFVNTIGNWQKLHTFLPSNFLFINSSKRVL